MTTIEMKEKTRGAKQSEDHSTKNHDETHEYDKMSSTSSYPPYDSMSSGSYSQNDQNPVTPEADYVYENPETPEPETVYTYPPVIPRKKWAGQ